MLTFYFLVLAGLVLFAGFLRTLTTRNEVGARYRTAVVARLCVTAVATTSYAVLTIQFATAYDLVGGMYQPNTGAILMFALRYMDWSVTVPLLTVELLAVCVIAGRTARWARLAAFVGAFGMIFAGFLGAIVIDDGQNIGQLILWGGISCVFWVFTNIVLIRAVRQSLPQLTRNGERTLTHATVVLLSGWVIYPLVYVIQIFGSGGGWATTMQICLCVADVTIKIGFGTLIHRVAKYRTAEDVRAGVDIHPQSIWISGVKLSDAGLPREVYLADDSTVHSRRPKPAANAATPSAHPIPDYDPDDEDAL